VFFLAWRDALMKGRKAMRRMHGLCSLAMLLAWLGAVRADDKCQQILDRAIQAHGAAKLEKQPAAIWKRKGMLSVVGLNIPFTGERYEAAKDRYRNEMSLEIAGERHQSVTVFNGKQGWSVRNNVLDEMPEEVLTEAKEQAHIDWAQRLYPLKDQAYTLSPVPDITVDDRPAEGFKVSHKGYRDLTFYFDTRTHLLAKCICQGRDSQTFELVSQEEFYSNYKDVNGIQVAMTRRIKLAGEDFMEIEIVEFRAALKLDEKLFQKPGK
jgi:hypothetical protein